MVCGKVFVESTPPDEVWIVRFQTLYNVNPRLWQSVFYAKGAIGYLLTVRQ